MAMHHQADWLAAFAIYEQNNHLAIATVCTVMRAGAGGINTPSTLNIKGLQHLPTALIQPSERPLNSLTARLAQVHQGLALVNHGLPPQNIYLAVTSLLALEYINLVLQK